MSEAKQVVGSRFGRLVVVDAGKSERRGKLKCRCDCGNVTFVTLGNLKRVTKSCGCLLKERLATGNPKHGMSYTKEYAIWRSMLQRCYNPKTKDFKYYGGRGIGVSDDWHDFRSFYRDMGPKPDAMSIDRIDNNSGYSKENCEWATVYQQVHNRRNAIKK